MSESHRIKGGTTDEAFQEQCFLWEKGASVKKMKKHNSSPLIILKKNPQFLTRCEARSFKKTTLMK